MCLHMCVFHCRTPLKLLCFHYYYYTFPCVCVRERERKRKREREITGKCIVSSLVAIMLSVLCEWLSADRKTHQHEDMIIGVVKRLSKYSVFPSVQHFGPQQLVSTLSHQTTMKFSIYIFMEEPGSKFRLSALVAAGATKGPALGVQLTDGPGSIRSLNKTWAATTCVHSHRKQHWVIINIKMRSGHSWIFYLKM